MNAGSRKGRLIFSRLTCGFNDGNSHMKSEICMEGGERDGEENVANICIGRFNNFFSK